MSSEVASPPCTVLVSPRILSILPVFVESEGVNIDKGADVGAEGADADGRGAEGADEGAEGADINIGADDGAEGAGADVGVDDSEEGMRCCTRSG